MARKLLFILLLSHIGPVRAAAETPAAAILHLTNGDFMPGALRGSETPDFLRWHCPHFTKPVEFSLNAANAVYYPLSAASQKATGEYCFELMGGDMLQGDLLAVTEDFLEVDAARLGRVQIRRGVIGRFYRWRNAESIYLGPGGLAGWKDAASTPQWQDQAGQLVTDKPGASLYSNLALPAKAIVELEISWEKTPDFSFALGVDDLDDTVKRAFRFEVWDNDLVAVGEAERDADAAVLQKVGPEAGSFRIQAFLNQEEGRLTLFSSSGRLLANLHLNRRKRQVFAGVRLTNNKGDVRLEHLRISRWIGPPPSDVKSDLSRLHRADGSILYGSITAFDPKSRQITVQEGTKKTTVKIADVTQVFLSPASVGAKTPAKADADATVCMIYQDGMRLSGKVTRIDDGFLMLERADFKATLRLPLTDLRSLIVLRRQQPAVKSAQEGREGRAGRLEMDSARLHGRLVKGGSQLDSSCLVWHADLARNPIPLRQGMTGRIVYRDPPPPPPKPDASTLRNGMVQRVVPAPAPRGAVQVLGDAISSVLTAATSDGPRYMHLRSGDTIPCTIKQIDEKGVTFKSLISDATFVSHDKIKSVELVPTPKPPRLNKAKRERLLTLPRLQRDAPPTHLVCSRNGDFLRGRVLEMDEKSLKVEVRLENKQIARDRVAQIIWLHADELLDSKPAAVAANVPQVTRVQSLRKDGKRLTFVAQKMENETISGVSDVLGACRVKLAEMDQLLFGAAIEQSAARLAYQRWKLHHAVDPKFAQNSKPGVEGQSGTESALVGKPAPTFKLDLLDGKSFQLADSKGKIVVLDFWATWCGPCMQTMPLVEGVARESANLGVELVAVNMEEQPDQIKAMLERHKLKIQVALDRDGVVAAKYNVTAIPQTVLIDREGKIARLFVGGGPKMADALKKAIQELIVAPTPPLPAARQ